MVTKWLPRHHWILVEIMAEQVRNLVQRERGKVWERCLQQTGKKFNVVFWQCRVESNTHVHLLYPLSDYPGESHYSSIKGLGVQGHLRRKKNNNQKKPHIFPPALHKRTAHYRKRTETLQKRAMIPKTWIHLHSCIFHRALTIHTWTKNTSSLLMSQTPIFFFFKLKGCLSGKQRRKYSCREIYTVQQNKNNVR